MATAVAAYDFRARHAKRAILVTRHSAGDGVEEGRPAAAGLELVVRLVERCVAAGAGVDAAALFIGVVAVVF